MSSGSQGLRNRHGTKKSGEKEETTKLEKEEEKKKTFPLKRGFDFFDVLLFCVVVFYVLSCPYAKVEESFNLQGIHDLVTHGPDLSRYDHYEFPGVVPRTFIGSLAVSLFSYPAILLLRMIRVSGVWEQVCVRIVLSFFSVFSFVQFRNAVRARLGSVVANLFVIITLCQFHLPFYMSRTLPNTFALCLVLLGYRFWLNSSSLYIVLIVFAGCVFRCELVLLLGPMVLLDLALKRLAFWKTVGLGCLCALLSLSLSILVDSHFWGYWLWPEAQGLLFNTVENRSHEWGVSPWYWYFTSALPRSLLLAYPISFLAIFVSFLKTFTSFSLFSSSPYSVSMREPAKAILFLGFPALCYVSLYSFLPHKELRFIFYALPLFSLIAAVAIVTMMQKIKNNFVSHLIILICLAIIGTGIAFCGVSTLASTSNYAGGHAFSSLHLLSLPSSTTPSFMGEGEREEREGREIEERCLRKGVEMGGLGMFISTEPRRLTYSIPVSQVKVHIDVPAAQTGVSRFGENDCGFWVYSKAEDLSDSELDQFHFLVTARSSLPSFDIVHIQEGFSRIQFYPGKIIKEPKIFILAHKNLTRPMVDWIQTEAQVREVVKPPPIHPIDPALEHWYFEHTARGH